MIPTDTLRRRLRRVLAEAYPDGLASATLVILEDESAEPLTVVLAGDGSETTAQGVACPACGSTDGFVHEGEFLCQDCFGFDAPTD